MKIHYPSISKFQQFVELKDYRPPTKKEYVRNVCKLAEHFQCDPATLSENQLRQYFLFLRQHKHYKAPPMKAAKYALLSFYLDHLKVSATTAATSPSATATAAAARLQRCPCRRSVSSIAFSNTSCPRASSACAISLG